MGRWDNLSIWKDPNKENPDHGKTESTDRDVLRDHPDPTADIALANVMRDERRKKSTKRNVGKRQVSQQMGHQVGHQVGPQTRGGRAADKEEKMRESVIESEFVKAVHEAGGLALKFTSQTINGVPDRLILFKIGKCAFVELKAPGKQMRPLQRKRKEQLEELGFPVFCIDSLEQIQPAIKAIMEWNAGKPIPKDIGAKIPELKRIGIRCSGEYGKGNFTQEGTVQKIYSHEDYSREDYSHGANPRDSYPQEGSIQEKETQ